MGSDLWVFAFDLNGTLDFGENPGPVPSKPVADAVRATGAWFGTASGRYPWWQLQRANEFGLRLDFNVTKGNIPALMLGIHIIHERKARVILIDDRDDIPGCVASMVGAKLISAEEFAGEWHRGHERYIRRLQRT